MVGTDSRIALLLTSRALSMYAHTRARERRDQRCEAVVLEVGMGGALDATNVVQTALSVVGVAAMLTSCAPARSINFSVRVVARYVVF